jgi:hypothetical protein
MGKSKPDNLRTDRLEGLAVNSIAIDKMTIAKVDLRQAQYSCKLFSKKYPNQ